MALLRFYFSTQRCILLLCTYMWRTPANLSLYHSLTGASKASYIVHTCGIYTWYIIAHIHVYSLCCMHMQLYVHVVLLYVHVFLGTGIILSLHYVLLSVMLLLLFDLQRMLFMYVHVHWIHVYIVCITCTLHVYQFILLSM